MIGLFAINNRIQKEEWRVVPGNEIVEVSNTGKVRRSISAPPAIHTYPGRPLKFDTSTKYARVAVRPGQGSQYKVLVHRLVAMAFMEPPTDASFVSINHIDGNKLNNNVWNLEWCSHKINTQHAWRNNLCTPCIGEKSGISKLTQRDVDVIKNSIARNVPISEIANVFNVHRETIRMIGKNQTWNN